MWFGQGLLQARSTGQEGEPDTVMPNSATGQLGRMNNTNERQHYVSRILLERFRSPGQPLQCYQVESERWKERSVDRVCSALGYTQLLLADGNANHAIETAFSGVESKLPKVLKLLERAASHGLTPMPKDAYETMCLYCAFLKQVSLFSKPAAVVTFLAQLNMEFENGHEFLVRELNMPGDVIKGFRAEYANGGRAIVVSQNTLQLIHRLQFGRLINPNYWEFLRCDWTISTSPIELPLSDIGIVPVRLAEHAANHYVLPISPTLVLEGVAYYDRSKHHTQQRIQGHKLSAEEAEYRLDLFCASAVREVICRERRSDIKESRVRAKAKGIRFHTIVDPDLAQSAGLKAADNRYGIRMVSKADYVRFMHSFVQPPAAA
jgi:hypothetical protein